MNRNLIKLLLLPVVLVLILGYNQFSKRTLNERGRNEVQQYLKDIGEFGKNGKIEIIKVYPYEGKLKLESNQKAIALQIRVLPENSVIDIGDIELHSKSGEFLGYAEELKWLDKDGKDVEFDENETPYYYVILFKVPRDFEIGEIKYSNKSHGSFSL